MEIQINFWTIIGLVIALFGPFVITAYKKSAKTEVGSLTSKFSLWFLVIIIFLILFYGENETLHSIGFKKVTTRAFFIGFVGGIGSMAIMGLTFFIFKKTGFNNRENSFEKIIKLSLNKRVFIVLTAAFVEEILFRGYAIERLSLLTHNIWIAGIISTTFFTIAHISGWSIRHLIPVFITGLFLSILYIIEKDIIACIIAHSIIDGVAFILMPYLMNKKMQNKNIIQNGESE